MVLIRYYCKGNYSIKISLDFSTIWTPFGQVPLQFLNQILKKEWRTDTEGLKEICITDTIYVFRCNGILDSFNVIHFYNSQFPEYRYVEKICYRDINFYPHRIDLGSLV